MSVRQKFKKHRQLAVGSLVLVNGVLHKITGAARLSDGTYPALRAPTKVWGASERHHIENYPSFAPYEHRVPLNEDEVITQAEIEASKGASARMSRAVSVISTRATVRVSYDRLGFVSGFEVDYATEGTSDDAMLRLTALCFGGQLKPYLKALNHYGHYGSLRLKYTIKSVDEALSIDAQIQDILTLSAQGRVHVLNRTDR